MAFQGRRRYLKDLRSLHLTIDEATDNHASISSVCGGRIEILLAPKEGPYAHATFVMEMAAMDNYPFSCPEIRLLTPIFHPNIRDDDGYICLSIISDWNSCYSLLDVVKAVLFLLSNPNFDDPNNRYGVLRAEYRSRFDEVCRQFLAGFPVKGRSFPPNESWCNWAQANNCFPSPICDQRVCESHPIAQLTSRMLEAVPVIDPTTASLCSVEERSQNRRKRDDSDDSTVDSTSSTHVPSVASVRYSLGAESDRQGSLYCIIPCPCFHTLRILLRRQESRQPSIFYFCDYLGCHNCQKNPQNVYFCNSDDLNGEEQQANFGSISPVCSFIPWGEYETPFYLNGDWEGCTKTDSLRGLPGLFGEESVISSEGESNEDDECNSNSSTHDGSLSYLYVRRNNTNDHLLSHCSDCNYYYWHSVRLMQDIKPHNWVFFQTRWPPVLAPGQLFDFKTNCPNYIPGWRGSTPRLVQDLAIFHRNYPRLDFILLLDPLALSPWSPIVNLLCPLPGHPSSTSTTTSSTSDQWTSLLWLSTADTFYGGASADCYAPLSQQRLHFLTRLALITNWLAWFSRLEISAVLGQSRHSKHIISEGVATACLHPAGLGCGQAPLLDVWPAWLVRLLLRMSCGLVTRLCFSSSVTAARCCFPLSDTDEI
ncbi:hypothetical protein SprV_0802630700 [Sparganum proliferum]